MANYTDFSPLAKLAPFDPNAEIGIMGDYAWKDVDPDFEQDQAERTILCTTPGFPCQDTPDPEPVNTVVTQDTFTIDFGKVVNTEHIREYPISCDGEQIATLKMVKGEHATWFLQSDLMVPSSKTLSSNTTTAKKQAVKKLQQCLYARHQGRELAAKIAARKAGQQL